MMAPNNSTMMIRWVLYFIGAILVAFAGFIGQSFSGELRELRKSFGENRVTSEKRLSIVETMVDNIQGNVKEIKQDVKDTQEDVRTIDRNISDIKQMIMEQELRRMREAKALGLRTPGLSVDPGFDLELPRGRTSDIR